MRKYLPVLQEVGICLLFVLVAVLVNAFLFKDLFFKELSVPGANEYASIDQNKYKVVGDIQDAQNATSTNNKHIPTSCNTGKYFLIKTSKTLFFR